jgi:hypothetical protein
MNMTKYTVTVEDDTTTWHDTNGYLHRTNGPAIITTGGYKQWFRHGLRHRDDGPAIVTTGGYKSWWQHGERHRDDGPAIEYADGHKVWWLNGTELSEAEFNQQVNGCVDKIITIDGVKYKLTPV